MGSYAKVTALLPLRCGFAFFSAAAAHCRHTNQDYAISTPGSLPCALPGWYTEVAALLPVHLGFASLVDAALQVLSNPSSRDAVARLAASGFLLVSG